MVNIRTHAHDVKATRTTPHGPGIIRHSASLRRAARHRAALDVAPEPLQACRQIGRPGQRDGDVDVKLLWPQDHDRGHYRAVGDADLLTAAVQRGVKEADLKDLAAVLDPTERGGTHRDVHAGAVWTSKHNDHAGENVAERGLRGDTHDHARQRAAYEQPAQIESCAGDGQHDHDAVQDDGDELGRAARPPQVQVALQGTPESLYEGTHRGDRDQRADQDEPVMNGITPAME